MDKTDKGMRDFIEQVLMIRFKGIPHKYNINVNNKGYNFHCPFCGDTDNTRKKPRGNIYLKSMTYKCFNDGCKVYVPIRKFVSIYSQKYNINIIDIDFDFDAEIDTAKFHVKLDKNNTIIDYLEDVDVLQVLPDMEDIVRRFSLRRISDMTDYSKAYRYLRDRLILDLQGTHDFIFSDSKDDKLYIFNYDKITNKVLNFSTRKLDVKVYKIYTFSDMMESLGIKLELKDPDIVDMICNYFNILNIDFNKPVKITEGQIDSLFLYNSAAIQGISKMSFIYDYIDKHNIYTFFDRDKGGIVTSIDDLKEGYYVFMWGLLVARLRRKFNSDVKTILKMKDVNDLYKFLYKHTQITIKEFNELTDKYYTNSIYDMLYL